MYFIKDRAMLLVKSLHQFMGESLKVIFIISIIIFVVWTLKLKLEIS